MPNIMSIQGAGAAAIHHLRHEHLGPDEISVQALAGVLTAEQPSSWAQVSGKPITFAPTAHGATHLPTATDPTDDAFEEVVAGADKTTIVFTPLDGAVHRDYSLDYKWLPKTGATTAKLISLFVNAFLTKNQYLGCSGYNGVTVAAWLQSPSNADPLIGFGYTINRPVLCHVEIYCIGDLFAYNAIAQCVGPDSNIYQHIYSGFCTQAVANITTLTISCDAANGIGIGSVFRLRPRK